MMSIAEKISHLIEQEIDVNKIQIVDESYKHANHQKDTKGGHFKLFIVSDAFIDISLLNRHKLIYKILDKMMKVEIHALSMKLLTNLEYDK